MTNLLEQAKSQPKRTIHKITPQIVELAVAWANEEISITQVKNALKVSENNKAYSILARALKEKIKKMDKNKEGEKLKEVDKPEEEIKETEKLNEKEQPENNSSDNNFGPSSY